MQQSSVYSRMVQRLYLYFPALLMALLALGTMWLVRSTGAVLTGQPKEESKRRMDYEMLNFQTTVYSADGQVSQSLRGAHLAHFSTKELELQTVQLSRQIFGKSGQMQYTQARADRAFGQDDGQDITLMGNVFMRQAQEGQAPLQMQGVRVRIFDQGQRLQAIEGVKMQRGDLSMQGAAMDWDSNSRVLTMHGAVRTVVMP